MQGVGFRPFVYRLAGAQHLSGWVRNAGDGVEIFVEGPAAALDAFLLCVQHEAPPAARISGVDVWNDAPAGSDRFDIVESKRVDRPTVRISPDLPVCGQCVRELRDPADRRAGYPYINCTNCGPRFTIIEQLPYDRPHTTMKAWVMCEACSQEYENPLDRRYHAQPVACPACGPAYRFVTPGGVSRAADAEAIRRAADALSAGRIGAVKGLGGYHLACDARRGETVRALRKRKFRKEKPFAVMVRDLEAARELVLVSEEARAVLEGPVRPIVIMPAREPLEDVAPGSDDLGIMLPYAPLHVLLFDAGCPAALVMTSANRSSEPIAYRDDDAVERLTGIADFFLMGDRPIARRVDDSVVRPGPAGTTVLRRSRGYAPAPAAVLPAERPILAVGADLKNAITLVVGGEAFVSQHIGDLEHFDALTAFDETVEDLLDMYRVREDELLVVHDAHPEYVSTRRAQRWGAERAAVQHHRAHVASVLVERGDFERRVVGLALDGTGYGDDGTIWGGEVFAGSLAGGFDRVAHLRPASLPGGDAAATHPVQAAAGFLAALDGLPNLEDAPFSFPKRYGQALQLLSRQVRTFETTSTGRLFDTAAALLGFTRPITFEGQAAIWLERRARRSRERRAYPFPDLDYRPLLSALVADVAAGVRRDDAARAFHMGLADGFAASASALCERERIDTVVLSGGVFQNQLLTGRIFEILTEKGLHVWSNRHVPPNDGGISLGQAALAGLERASFA